MANIKRTFLLFLTSLLLSACIYDSRPDKDTTELNLKSLEQYVEYAESNIYIGGYLYVNDMPKVIIDTDKPVNNDFIAIISIETVEGGAPDNNISNSKLYVVQDDVVLWESPVNVEPELRTLGNKLEVIFRGGPSTLRNKIVDIVLEFESQGEQYRVLAKGRHVSVVF